MKIEYIEETPYKRFMVFEDNDYESQGGLNDCTQSFDNIEDALTYADNSKFDAVAVFDRIDGRRFELPD